MLLLRYSTAVICAVFIATGSVSGQDQIKAVGDTVSFRPTINPPVTSIIWKHRSSSGVVVKAIEWDEDGFNIPNQRFKGITTLNEKTGLITITNLTVDHSGVYTIDINSKEQEQRFKLEVLKPVPQPVIEVESSTNRDVVYLRCNYSETIIWKNSAGETLNGSKNHQPGEFITVENKGNPKNFYTCTLKNALGEKTSDKVFEENLFASESNAGLIAGIIIVIVLVLIIIFLICVYLRSGPIYRRVNKSCPCIEGVLAPVDCWAERRQQYSLAPKGERVNGGAASPGDGGNEVAANPGDGGNEVAANPGEGVNEAVSPGERVNGGAASPDQKNNEVNHAA